MCNLDTLTDEDCTDAILDAARQVGSDGHGRDGLAGYIKRIAVCYPPLYLTLLRPVLELTAAEPAEEIVESPCEELARGMKDIFERRAGELSPLTVSTGDQHHADLPPTRPEHVLPRSNHPAELPALPRTTLPRYGGPEPEGRNLMVAQRRSLN
jgi:hypothetical protein